MVAVVEIGRGDRVGETVDCFVKDRGGGCNKEALCELIVDLLKPVASTPREVGKDWTRDTTSEVPKGTELRSDLNLLTVLCISSIGITPVGFVGAGK